MDLALNNLQRSICHKTQQTKWPGIWYLFQILRNHNRMKIMDFFSRLYIIKRLWWIRTRNVFVNIRRSTKHNKTKRRQMLGSAFIRFDKLHVAFKLLKISTIQCMLINIPEYGFTNMKGRHFKKTYSNEIRLFNRLKQIYHISSVGLQISYCFSKESIFCMTFFLEEEFLYHLKFSFLLDMNQNRQSFRLKGFLIPGYDFPNWTNRGALMG